MNTVVLFKDHQTNNFYYHERHFTHRNINKYYVNGNIIYSDSNRNLMTSLERKALEGDDVWRRADQSKEVVVMSRRVTTNN